MNIVLHMTNCYPNHLNPHETRSIKELYDACDQYVKLEIWYVQVRNECILFRICLSEYSKNEQFTILATKIQVWGLQKILMFLLLVMPSISSVKIWWDVIYVCIAYQPLSFTRRIQTMFGETIVIAELLSTYSNNYFFPIRSKAAKRFVNIFDLGLPAIALYRALMCDIVRFVVHEDCPKHIFTNAVSPDIFFREIRSQANTKIFLMNASWTNNNHPFLVVKEFKSDEKALLR